MTSFAAVSARAAGTIFKRLGEPARVTPPFEPTREQQVIVDRNVELVGDNGEVAGRKTVVSLVKADGAVPQNTEIRVGAGFDEVFYAEQPVDDDGEVLKVAVR